MQIESILSKLQNTKKNGSGYSALCPAHNDKERSLSITNKGGKILINCFAGCDSKAVLNSLGLDYKDLFENDNNFTNGYKPKPEIVKIYDYTDSGGKVLYQNIRYKPKNFKQRAVNPDGSFTHKLRGVERVPYRLPKLIKNNGSQILLTEGEQDSDNLHELGFITSSFKNWKAEFSEFIKDSDVVLLVDHDQSGIKQSEAAKEKLINRVKSVKIVDLFKSETFPDKHGKDVSDWLELGHTKEELLKIIENTPKAKKDVPATITPIPLPKVLGVPKLDESLIPAQWRVWLTDIAERLQCPLEYPTISALVAASALIGNRVSVKPKQMDSWQSVPNLWGSVIGMPSMLKSPALDEGLFFFREIEKQERKNFEEVLKDYEFNKEFSEAKKSELKKEMRKKDAKKEVLRNKYELLEVDAPIKKRLSTSDSTVEKLGELLNENENGILVLRDELTGWFRSLEKTGRENDRAFYLECWNGSGEFTFDRISRGEIHIKNLTVSMLGTIQPAMLKPFLRGSIDGSGDDGLVQRFQLMVYPDTSKTYEYVDSKPKGRDEAKQSFRSLYEFDPAEIGAKQLAKEFGETYFIQFDGEAQEFFKNWLCDLEISLRSDTFDTPAFASHLGKYRSLMPSLALIFHLLENLNSKNPCSSISIKHAKTAAAWCSFLEKHAAKIYQMATVSEFDIARSILEKIDGGKVSSPFTARDIYGKHWANLSKPKPVQNGLDILTEYGHLKSEVQDTGGRPTKRYFINKGE